MPLHNAVDLVYIDAATVADTYPILDAEVRRPKTIHLDLSKSSCLEASALLVKLIIKDVLAYLPPDTESIRLPYSEKKGLGNVLKSYEVDEFGSCKNISITLSHSISGRIINSDSIRGLQLELEGHRFIKDCINSSTGNYSLINKKTIQGEPSYSVDYIGSGNFSDVRKILWGFSCIISGKNLELIGFNNEPRILKRQVFQVKRYNDLPKSHQQAFHHAWVTEIKREYKITKLVYPDVGVLCISSNTIRFSMPQIPGKTLAMFLKDCKQSAGLSFKKALTILQTFLKETQNLHDKYIAHHDLNNLSNIIIHEENGSIAIGIIDFGIAEFGPDYDELKRLLTPCKAVFEAASALQTNASSPDEDASKIELQYILRTINELLREYSSDAFSKLKKLIMSFEYHDKKEHSADCAIKKTETALEELTRKIQEAKQESERLDSELETLTKEEQRVIEKISIEKNLIDLLSLQHPQVNASPEKPLKEQQAISEYCKQSGSSSSFFSTTENIPNLPLRYVTPSSTTLTNCK